MENLPRYLHASASNITNILSHLEDEGIFLTVNLNHANQLLKEEKHPYNERSITVPYILPSEFEFTQGAILKRVRENIIAKNHGWLVSNFGNVYTHQYGRTNYVFIERNSDGSLDVYRCRFNKDDKADNVKTIGTHIGDFSEARELAADFLGWFYSKSLYGSRPY